MTSPPVLDRSAPLQAFRGIRAATRGLIAGPWTPASLSLLPRNKSYASLTARIARTVLDSPHGFIVDKVHLRGGLEGV